MTKEEVIYCMESYLSNDSYEHCIKCKYYKEDSCESSEAHAMAIKALESQKIAKWIPVPSNIEQGEREFIWWKCSNCGHIIYSETEKDRLEFHRFCGRCGMMME